MTSGTTDPAATGARNVTLADLAVMLREQQARKVDIVAPASAIRTRHGQLLIDGDDPELGPYGVTLTTGSLRVGSSAGSDWWLWLDTYLVIGALIFTVEQAAAFLGLDDELAVIHAWMEDVEGRLAALRPSGPGEQHEEPDQAGGDGTTYRMQRDPSP